MSELPLAAVLLLFYPGNGNSTLALLTRRSSTVPQHAGQICLPGGRVEGSDASLEAAALREAAEETGLAPGDVRLLGRLPQVVMANSGFAVTPVVGWSQGRPVLRPEPREVAEVIECPVSALLDPAAYREDSMVTNNIKREFYFIEIEGNYIWGATARMLRSLALLLA